MSTIIPGSPLKPGLTPPTMIGLLPTTQSIPAGGPTTVSADASQNPAASLSLGTAGSADQLTQVFSLMLAIVQKLASGLNGGGGAVPPPGAAGPSTLAVAAPPLVNTTQDTQKKSQLDESMALIGQDPDGAKLLAKAKSLGVTIEAGDPAKAGGAFDVAVPCAACQAAAAADASGDPATAARIRAQDGDGGKGGTGASNDGNVVVNGVTLSNSQTGKIRIVVRDPSNIKTIVHELVHAVSTQDGNSKQEEGIADVVGSRVASRTGGAAVGALTGSERQIFLNKQQFYPELGANNDIRATLRALGIGVTV